MPKPLFCKKGSLAFSRSIIYHMNIATIKKNDIANGPGIRVSLFVSGCRHACPGCFNREAWDFDYGTPYTAETEQTILDALSPNYVEGLTLLGGEPFEAENQAGLLSLCRRVREMYPAKTIWCFTGFLYETLASDGTNPPLLNDRPAPGETGTRLALLAALDVLVDGRFEADKKNFALVFRGSSNQRILDVPASLAAGCAVWAKGVWERPVSR